MTLKSALPSDSYLTRPQRQPPKIMIFCSRERGVQYPTSIEGSLAKNCDSPKKRLSAVQPAMAAHRLRYAVNTEGPHDRERKTMRMLLTMCVLVCGCAQAAIDDLAL